ncbi:S-adenosyl-methyltransferase [Deferribacter desulfuricans SSM1]|uniref:Ribosomal RNA small subunit methyltransferase H n=1 Tax=Deferribacter desulfuricans (strain DSM 14783 / JCM 11476 / NBRC 101012 / SSM1) TaxID=639282 RepID=D3PBU7_DEFDS|nr:16S rRNA (cytosine(1402)-N(4))-methyltransferase RsmH [Deferribacter desulfuricans]BAI80070.1 S-adenosyl-methyltransferase [Deferribacter desulfuricans SSM1]
MHKPVLYNELISFFKGLKNGVIVDCTGGGGGHAEGILKEIKPERLIILDRDEDAIKRLNEKFKGMENVEIYKSNFSEIDSVLQSLKIEKVNGLYADFGVSNFHLLDSKRGFSFRRNGPLDMRMDKSLYLTAEKVVNEYSAETLKNIFRKFGEERFASKIADAIVKTRKSKRITTTLELAEIVKNAIPERFHKPGVHPATKVFMALRIFINNELESIESLLKKLPTIVDKGGIVAFISFHSLEDRLVKEYLQYYEKSCICPPDYPVCNCDKEKQFKILTKKPITPTEKEITENPLSRSAKMRVGVRV